jgi:hypothetical protein
VKVHTNLQMGLAVAATASSSKVYDTDLLCTYPVGLVKFRCARKKRHGIDANKYLSSCHLSVRWRTSTGHLPRTGNAPSPDALAARHGEILQAPAGLCGNAPTAALSSINLRTVTQVSVVLARHMETSIRQHAG